MALNKYDSPLARRFHPLTGQRLREIACEVGTTETQIRRWTLGLASPNLANARRIAKALDCTIDELFPVDEDGR